MCPVCMASAALVAGSVTTTGGVTAFVVNIFRKRKIARMSVPKNATRKEK
ncbi:MAG: hypothetical protein LAO18_14810 [Acidobacteriia bacterium]|nr:hypothetical protein [Terriglobia bacterium]